MTTAEARHECADLAEKMADDLPADSALAVMRQMQAGALREFADRLRRLAGKRTLGVPRRTYGTGETPP